jgi:hypothetical protein
MAQAGSITRISLVSGFALGLCAFGASDASAMVCFSVDGSPSCGGGMEQEIFVKDAKDVTKGFGNVAVNNTGLPLVEFTTGATGETVDLANGNGTITPSSKGHQSSFSTLDISVPGQTFTDLLFSLEMLKTASGSNENLTITAWDGTTVEGTTTFNNLAHDKLIDFAVVASGGEKLTAVDLLSMTGIKEAKSFDISGATIPEAPTWAMLALGFAGLGYAGYWRSRKVRISPLA